MFHEASSVKTQNASLNSNRHSGQKEGLRFSEGHFGFESSLELLQAIKLKEIKKSSQKLCLSSRLVFEGKIP